MRVGIISMQRVCNNGSFLQAYGLKKLIESLGHDVVFVDYQVEKPITRSFSEKKSYVLLKIRNAFIKIFQKYRLIRCFLPREYKEIVIERENYSDLIQKYLNIPCSMQYRAPVDAIVIGSDEVFNCTQINPEVGFSPELFGANQQASKILSYAASFGNTTFQKLQDFNKDDEVRRYLLALSSISVRDKNSKVVVESLTGITPEVNLDPVLMYDVMPTIKDEQIRKDYIIVYAYRARITHEEALEIKKFAQKEGKRLISVSGQLDFCDEHIVANPFDCLNLYRHADYIISDTFHGTIFSIINRKKFVTLIRKSMGSTYGNQEKLQDLLDRLGLQNRSYSNGSDDLPKRLLADIDYDSVFSIIEKERRHTMEYLKNQLK